MLPSPIWPLAEHASLGQNCCDASIGSVWFFISYSMPVDTCFFKSSFPFHRLVGSYRRHLLLSFYNDSPLLSTFFLISPAWCHLVAQLVGIQGLPFFLLQQHLTTGLRRLARFIGEP